MLEYVCKVVVVVAGCRALVHEVYVCQVVVPLPNHFRRVDPPPFAYVCRNPDRHLDKSRQIWTMHIHRHMQRGGVDPPEVVREWYNHLTTT